MKKLVLGGLSAAIMAVSGSAMAADFVAGKDYTVWKFRGKSKFESSFGMDVHTVLNLNRICKRG